MNIPNLIKFGGHQIKIEKVLNKDIDGPGEYNDYYRVIRIRKDTGISEDVVAEVFLHELLEVIRICNNLEINHTYLTVLSEGLFQIIRDNNLNFSEKEK
ncbi:hypothetical protein KAX02_13635 [candidate division WOR-3 bacterium]|nr:hypothetical protein [candidate division WOR-3 bacterium]